MFDIPVMLDVEDITSVKKPDEKIVLTYVSFFFKQFSVYKRDQANVNAIKKACDITIRHDDWIEQYNTGSGALKEWIAGTTAYYGERREGVEGFGNDTATIKATLTKLYGYKRDNKPVQKAAGANLEGVLNTLHASARNNNRVRYAPSEGHATADLEADWSSLEQQEEDYERACVASYGHFQQLECTQTRFGVKAGKLSNWIMAQSQLFQSGDFGASSVANLALLEVFINYAKQLELNKGVVEVLRGWSEDEGGKRSEEKGRVWCGVRYCAVLCCVVRVLLCDVLWCMQ